MKFCESGSGKPQDCHCKVICQVTEKKNSSTLVKITHSVLFT